MSSIYVSISDIPGESQLADYTDQIACVAMRHAIDMQVQSSGSRTTANSRHGAIELTHAIDKATPLLNLAVAAGQNKGTVTITRLRAGAVAETITLANAYVTRVDVEVPLNPETMRPGDDVMETFALDYSSISWDYAASSGTISGSYNVATGGST